MEDIINVQEKKKHQKERILSLSQTEDIEVSLTACARRNFLK